MNNVHSTDQMLRDAYRVAVMRVFAELLRERLIRRLKREHVLQLQQNLETPRAGERVVA